ncbi:hypothetical protein AY599_19165 [Leptolyngbya valderiana BDU 20041]|nr:hypothetical protein AY599_19165 [Leptolyngbya valderiana BDU 20041]
MRTAASIAILVATSTAAAQGSPYFIEIVVDPPVIEPGERATIELRAHFPVEKWAIGWVQTSLLSSTGDAGLTYWRIVPPMDGPLSARGDRTGAGIESINARQIQFPWEILADTDNPMVCWRVDYVAPPELADRQEIDLWTRSSRFEVYATRDSYGADSFLREMVDGQATLTIVACRADINGDGALDLFDFLAFFNAFDAGEPIADFDFDGALTGLDFLAFQNRFGAGCS